MRIAIVCGDGGLFKLTKKTVKRSLLLNRTGQFKRYQHFRILHNEKEQYSTEQLTFNAGDFDGFMCGCDATKVFIGNTFFNIKECYSRKYNRTLKDISTKDRTLQNRTLQPYINPSMARTHNQNEK